MNPRSRPPLLAAVMAAALAAAPHGAAQAPADPSPEAERASLRVLDGFEVGLFASESDGVRKPIQIRFGPDGRLWVAGSVVYPQLRPGEKPHDRIVVLEDTDRDGRADRSTVFADDLLMPTGLELGDGGVYVTSGTELLHLRDTDGDGRADVREVVLRGFGTGDTHQTLNSFTWEPSGGLLMSQGLHALSRVETPWGVVELRQAGLWRLWPGERRLESFWSGAMGAHNPFGTTHDRWGQPFVFAGNGHGIYHLTPGLVATDHFLEQPWLWNQGRKFGGADFADNGHWPDDHRGEVLSGGYLQNTVERFRIRDEGRAGYAVDRLPPLVESTNTAFRVVDVRFGPDGALYLCDWYNPVIGHYQASFRDPARDRERGRIWRVTARGRKPVPWRPVAERPLPDLVAALGSPERWEHQQALRVLAGLDPDAVAGAVRTALDAAADPGRQCGLLGALAAARRIDPPALARAAASPHAGVRAFAARITGEAAGRPAGPGRIAPGDALALLGTLVADPHPRVRLEAVVACSRVPDARAVEVAARIADAPLEPALEYAFTQCVHALGPHWRPAADRGALAFDGHPAREALFGRAAGGGDAARRAAARLRRVAEVALEPETIARLAATVASGGGTNELLTLLAPGGFRRGTTPDPALHADALRAAAAAAEHGGVRPGETASSALKPLLGSPDPGLRGAAARLAGAWRVESLRPEVDALASDAVAPDSARAEALAGLAGYGDGAARDRLASFSAAGDLPPAVRTAALAQMARLDPDRAAPTVAAWLAADRTARDVQSVLTPFLQRPAGTTALRGALAARPPSAANALAALGWIGVSGRRDPGLAGLLEQAAGLRRTDGPATVADIPDLVAALARGANPENGARLFASPNLACIGCHSVDGTPGRVGPDLSALGTAQNPAFILGALLEPQREVKEGFMAWEIVTRDGTTYQGYLQGADTGDVTLADHLTGTTVRIPAADVATRTRLGSLMPAGLVDGLGRDELRDLLAYLSGLGRRGTGR